MLTVAPRSMRTHLRDRTFSDADPVAKWQGCPTMSQLKLFRPTDDAAPHGDFDESPPLIYSISAFRIPARGGNRQSTAARARAIHANRTCPACGRTTVVPLEFRDAARNRNLMPVPGTATLAGFSCHGCGAEWSLDGAVSDG